MSLHKKNKSKKKKLLKSVSHDSSLAYYYRIYHALDKDFEDNEEKSALINNVLEQLEEDALSVSQNNIGSQLIEKLLEHANMDQFVKITKCISNDWEVSCTDKSASFTLQCIIRISSKFLSANRDCSGIDKMKYEELQNELQRLLFVDLLSFIESQFAFFMQHSSASHVIRSIIELLACERFDDQIMRGSRCNKSTGVFNTIKRTNSLSFSISKKNFFTEQLTKLINKLVKLPKLEDHACNKLSNPVLQSMVLSLKSLPTNDSKMLLDEFIENSRLFKEKTDKEVLAICEKEVGSYLMEQILVAVSDDKFQEIFNTYFKGKALTMATSPIGNFVLQRLISSIRNIEQFEHVYQELFPHFESIFALNHVGVVIQLCKACLLYPGKQKKFIKHMCKAFHCYKPETRRCKFTQLLLSLTTYDVFFKLEDKIEKNDSEMPGGNEIFSDSLVSQKDKSEDHYEEDDEDEMSFLLPQIQSVNIYGSQIMQNLLQFQNVSLVVQGLFELNIKELKMLCNDASGCRVIEAFLDSVNVPEKHKDVFFNKLKTCYFLLACSKWGSRTFDAIWKNANVETKQNIVSELIENASKLRANRYGVFIFNKCQIDLYKRNPQAWMKSLTEVVKKRKFRT